MCHRDGMNRHGINLQKLLFFSTLTSAAVLILIISYTHQTNICVQSNFIEKVVFGKTEVASCAKNIRIDWDSKVDKEVKALNEKLAKVENYLKLRTKLAIKLEILEQRNVFYYTGNHLFISKNVIMNSQSLELFLIKKWVENHNSTIKENKILEDLLVNFKYYLIYGDLAKAATVQGFQPKISWRQIQNASHHNCVTNWRLTKNWDLCINSSYQFFETSFDFVYDRLYAKALGSWVDALNLMTLSQRYELNNNFQTHLVKFNFPELDLTARANSFSYNVRVLSQFWLLDKDIPNTFTGKKFLFSFLKGLNKYKFNSIIENSKFDLIYFKQNLNWNTVYENKQIHMLIKKYPNLKIAISNFKEMMILPVEKKIKVDVFSMIKSNQIVLETCSTMNIRDLMKYAKISDKLILTYDCDFNQFKKIDQLLVTGASGFAAQNMDVQFAQFHLPSMVQKREQLNMDSEVFQFVQARNVKNSVYEVFGWQELNWDQVTKAYKPRAYVDGVGYFRTKFSYQ